MLGRGKCLTQSELSAWFERFQSCKSTEQTSFSTCWNSSASVVSSNFTFSQTVKCGVSKSPVYIYRENRENRVGPVYVFHVL